MSNSQDGREGGFMDKIGDAARNVFGGDAPNKDEAGEQRYKDGRYSGERAPGQAQPYPMGDVADTATGSHYARDEVLIAGSAGTNDRGNYADDDHYRQARDRHMSIFDRDYDEYRREHGSTGSVDFGDWHTARRGQRADDARNASTEAETQSRAEAGNRALGESEAQGSDGPHILERSFSGTYDKE